MSMASAAWGTHRFQPRPDGPARRYVPGARARARPRAHVERVDGDITTIAFPEGGESDWMQTVDVDTSQGLIVGRGNLDDGGWSSRVQVTVFDQIPDSVNVP
jgi:hypothetical protein